METGIRELKDNLSRSIQRCGFTVCATDAHLASIPDLRLVEL